MELFKLIVCKWCETVSAEEQLVIKADNEFCPKCGKTGYLMDTEEVAK